MNNEESNSITEVCITHDVTFGNNLPIPIEILY